MQKPVQLLLILLLSFMSGFALSHGAFAETAPTPTFPPVLVQSWKDYLKNYPEALAQYQKEEQAVRQAAKPVEASEEKNIDDLMKTYPFLQKDLQNTKDIQLTIADSLKKNPDLKTKQSLDATPHLQIAESKDSKTGINLFFLAKSGRFWCSPHGCPMNVYVDTGAGYKEPTGFMVSKGIFMLRDGKNVFLFAGPPQDPGVVEWVLKDHNFVINTPPPPEPPSPEFAEWKSQLQQAGKWPPQ